MQVLFGGESNTKGWDHRSLVVRAHLNNTAGSKSEHFQPFAVIATIQTEAQPN
jgi:hypothetical protein